MEPLKTKKQKPLTRIETQNTENKNSPRSQHHKTNVNQEDRMNVQLIKKSKIEKKTTLSSHRNQEWKELKKETEK